MNPHRRLLLQGTLRALAATGAGLLPVWTRALPLRELRFPRDFGSHPELRTEWWYITGHAREREREFGFQITFFRSRIDETQGMTSAFAARQVVFAHAALTDLDGARLWHAQRIARAGMGVAAASEQDTALRLRDWMLIREGGSYRARASSDDFALDLVFTPTQPVLPQGVAGLSRKGPEPSQASYYYSEPQLAAGGGIRLKGRRFEVTGKAWLDHEWSEALLHPEAVGWDWVGMNLDDGAALTVFHLRDATGAALWAGGSIRPAGGLPRSFAANEVSFEALRHWTSPNSRARYPVEWRVRTPAGVFRVRSLLDDQELDSRGSTGAIYWEGLSDLLDEQGRRIGRGYLEMTGYASPLRL
ncbi:MAG: carotenoid 1,2-hydratase [Comamonadaceae bacterium]|nr:MAG: carotenoid 1,2-hydratase [Comamonadaceae bacterium]